MALRHTTWEAREEAALSPSRPHSFLSCQCCNWMFFSWGTKQQHSCPWFQGDTVLFDLCALTTNQPMCVRVFLCCESNSVELLHDTSSGFWGVVVPLPALPILVCLSNPSCSLTDGYESFSYCLFVFTQSCCDCCCKPYGRSALAHFSLSWFYHFCLPPHLLTHPFHLCHFSRRQLFPGKKSSLINPELFWTL